MKPPSSPGSWDKSIRVWDPLGGKERRRPLLGHNAAVNFVAFNSGGEIIASAAGAPRPPAPPKRGGRAGAACPISTG